MPEDQPETDTDTDTDSPRLPAIRLAPGEVVEITLDDGRAAHVQITHRHPSGAEVLRLVAGLREPLAGATPPGTAAPRIDESRLTALTARPAAGSLLAPLSDMIRRGMIGGQPLGRAPVPEGARDFPVFRTPIRDRQGVPIYWWFWDGDGLSLSPPEGCDPDTLPLREITGARALVERLARL